MGSSRVLTVTLTAAFLADGGDPRIPILLGLRGGFFEGRLFRAEYNPDAPYEQDWWLSDN